MDKSKSPKLPGFVSEVVSRLPSLPASFLFVTGLNLVLVRLMPEDTLEQIEGKCLRVHVTDAGVRLDYRWDGSAFGAVSSAQAPDVTFAATARDFLVLMQREEDPDTLFFSRRLTIEGDTELGLLLKNTLDAIDASELQPREILAKLISRTPLRGLRLPGLARTTDGAPAP